MRYARRVAGVLLGVALCVSSTVCSAATSIVFEVKNITDRTAGEDVWQYRYTVSGGFEAFSSFEILFDALKVGAIEAMPAAPNPDWFVSSVTPISGVPSDGLYSAMALTSNPSLSSSFEVTFVWNGPGVPGAQSFNVLDGAFGLIESGTTLPIPEPQTYALLGAGLLVVLARLRRRCA